VWNCPGPCILYRIDTGISSREAENRRRNEDSVTEVTPPVDAGVGRDFWIGVRRGRWSRGIWVWWSGWWLCFFGRIAWLGRGLGGFGGFALPDRMLRAEGGMWGFEGDFEGLGAARGLAVGLIFWFWVLGRHCFSVRGVEGPYWYTCAARNVWVMRNYFERKRVGRGLSGKNFFGGRGFWGGGRCAGEASMCGIRIRTPSPFHSTVPVSFDSNTRYIPVSSDFHT
jgi:hypothetical protein